MIRHIVMWRLKSEAKQGGRIQNLDRIQGCLASMRTGVPGVLRLEIGANQAEGPDASDLVLLADFASWEALQGYERHALHDELRALIGPMRTERRVLDYEI